MPEGNPPLATRVDVEELFERNGDSVLADGALKPGTSVIVEGNERLMPGAPVSPQDRPQAPVAVGTQTPKSALQQ